MIDSPYAKTYADGNSECSSASTAGLKLGRYNLDISPIGLQFGLSSYVLPEEERIYRYLEDLELHPVNLQDYFGDKL